ncbi:hypothetical protein D3C71_2069890 [compost metagenome]
MKISEFFKILRKEDRCGKDDAGLLEPDQKKVVVDCTLRSDLLRHYLLLQQELRGSGLRSVRSAAGQQWGSVSRRQQQQ